MKASRIGKFDRFLNENLGFIGFFNCRTFLLDVDTFDKSVQHLYLFSQIKVDTFSVTILETFLFIFTIFIQAEIWIKNQFSKGFNFLWYSNCYFDIDSDRFNIFICFLQSRQFFRWNFGNESITLLFGVLNWKLSFERVSFQICFGDITIRPCKHLFSGIIKFGSTHNFLSCINTLVHMSSSNHITIGVIMHWTPTNNMYNICTKFTVLLHCGKSKKRHIVFLWHVICFDIYTKLFFYFKKNPNFILKLPWKLSVTHGLISFPVNISMGQHLFFIISYTLQWKFNITKLKIFWLK